MMINIAQAKDDALKFLKEGSTAVVATSFQDKPRASTVYYFVDDEFNFYFATKRNTSKYINAEMNPRAAVVVGTGPEHISVQAYGQVELIVNEQERERVIGLLVGGQNLKGVTIWPIDELKNLRYGQKVIFKIIPEEMYYMNLDSSKHEETTSDDYMKII